MRINYKNNCTDQQLAVTGDSSPSFSKMRGECVLKLDEFDPPKLNGKYGSISVFGRTEDDYSSRRDPAVQLIALITDDIKECERYLAQMREARDFLTEGIMRNTFSAASWSSSWPKPQKLVK
jgi:hypothetical protein